MTTASTSTEVRAHIVETFRRDLIGPGSQDSDLATERLNENPSRWYLAGFLAPADDPLGMDAPPDAADDIGVQEEMEIQAGDQDVEGAGGAAGDREQPEAPNTSRRFLPSS